MIKLIPIILMPLFLSGCIFGHFQADITRIRTEETKAIAKSTDMRAYLSYQIQMAKINTIREKSGLKPLPLMTETQWETARGLSKD